MKFFAKSGYNGYILKNAPEKVLQFGEGNFARAFITGSIWPTRRPTERQVRSGPALAPGLAKMINEQEGLPTPCICAAVKTAGRSMTARYPASPAA